MSNKRRINIDKMLERPEMAEYRRTMGVTDAIVDDDGYYALELEIKDIHLNRMGITHGGILFALADTAAGTYAFRSGGGGVTQDGSIRYFATSTAGDILHAVVHPRKMGRTVSVLNVEIINQDEKLVADATITMHRVDYSV